MTELEATNQPTKEATEWSAFLRAQFLKIPPSKIRIITNLTQWYWTIFAHINLEGGGIILFLQPHGVIQSVESYWFDQFQSYPKFRKKVLRKTDPTNYITQPQCGFISYCLGSIKSKSTFWWLLGTGRRVTTDWVIAVVKKTPAISTEESIGFGEPACFG